MELAGNLFERVVMVGNPTGRLFDGAHGDGALATDGNANGTALQYWPGYNAGSQEILSPGQTGFSAIITGSGSRGTNCGDEGPGYTAIRIYGATGYSIRYYWVGIRCGRTEGS
jgi:hypothetical protein